MKKIHRVEAEIWAIKVIKTPKFRHDKISICACASTARARLGLLIRTQFARAIKLFRTTLSPHIFLCHGTSPSSLNHLVYSWRISWAPLVPKQILLYWDLQMKSVWKNPLTQKKTKTIWRFAGWTNPFLGQFLHPSPVQSSRSIQRIYAVLVPKQSFIMYWDMLLKSGEKNLLKLTNMTKVKH